jgi:hypothetical protein
MGGSSNTMVNKPDSQLSIVRLAYLPPYPYIHAIKLPRASSLRPAFLSAGPSDLPCKFDPTRDRRAAALLGLEKTTYAKRYGKVV